MNPKCFCWKHLEVSVAFQIELLMTIKRVSLYNKGKKILLKRFFRDYLTFLLLLLFYESLIYLHKE